MKKVIEIREVHWNPLALYQNANVKSISQRALLGYMEKDGYLRDPIYGGAFALLREFEDANGIPIITSDLPNNRAMEIHDIAERAKLGEFDAFALAPSEIRDTICRLCERRKGGK